MINSSDITIIIPIFNLKGNRIKSFYCVLDSISKTNIPVIVCEQVKSESEKIDLSNYGSNIGYVQNIIDSDLIQKAKLINLAVSKCVTKYIWQLDADVILKWNDILKNINDENLIRPFEKVIRLTIEETENYYKDKTITIKKDDQRIAITSFGPISFIIKKDIFLSENGMCEEYEGWGFEDLDFARKMKSKYKVHVIRDSYGVHLWHEHTLSKNKEAQKNKQLFMENEKYIIPTKNLYNFENDSMFSNKIVHISSYCLKNEDSNKRQYLAHNSVIKNLPNNSIHINVTNEEKSFMFNCNNILNQEEKPFIDDLFDIASKYCNEDNDIIIFTNSDCAVDEKFYENINKNIENICFLYRRNIYEENNINLTKLYTQDHELHINGVDGIAITKKQYAEIKNLIPHMKIAEPRWDNVIYKNIISNDVLFNNVLGVLYHIEHNRNWSPKDDNYNLRYVKNNFGETPNINIVNGEHSTPIVSIICCSYTPVYKKEYIDCKNIFLKNIRYQNIPHELIFVEMGFGDTYYFNNVSDIGKEAGYNYKHIKITGSEKNKFLFHKESLWNIGKEHATTDILIFCDADVISKDTTWLTQIYGSVVETPDSIVQPFNTVEDTVDEEIKYVSRVSRLVDNNYYYSKTNPGICWAMHRKTFDDIGGFNNLCILGGGDTCFLEENVESKYLPKEKMASKWKCFVSLRNNKREFENKKQIKYLRNINLIHINHGDIGSRKYIERNFILYYVQERLKRNYVDYIEKNKIIEWKNTENELLWLIKEKLNIPSEEKEAFSFFDRIISQNICRICEGNLKVVNAKFTSSLNNFKEFWGKNIIKKSEQVPIIIEDNLPYILLETHDKNEYAEVFIPIYNWEYKKIDEYVNLFTFFKSDKDDVFFNFFGEQECSFSDGEKKLNNGNNDISKTHGFYKFIKIKFKNKLLLNRIFLIKGNK